MTLHSVVHGLLSCELNVVSTVSTYGIFNLSGLLGCNFIIGGGIIICGLNKKNSVFYINVPLMFPGERYLGRSVELSNSCPKTPTF